MGDLSPHFSSHEFVDHVTGHRFDPPAQLLAILEKIRAQRGRPLKVVSGHRCCGHNAEIGGAGQSRHIAGDAVDLAPGIVTLSQARGYGAVGVGVRAGWAVHVDVRPGPTATWAYD